MTRAMSIDGRMSRRRFLAAAAVTAGSAALAGCGTATSTGGGGGGGGEVAKEITLLNWDIVQGSPLEAAIAAFEKASGIHVIVQPTPSGGSYDTKAQTLLAGGTAPDVMRINDNYVRQYSSLGQLADLSPFLKNDVKPDDYLSAIYNFPKQSNGQYTAWCLGTQPRVIFYNVDMFRKAGVDMPPTTYSSKGWSWDDFLERARQLTTGGKQWGALVFDDTGYEQTFSVNNGVTEGVFSKDGKSFTLASPKGVEAVQWVTDLSTKHHVQQPWSELQPNNANFDDDLFVGGKIAMIFRPLSLVAYYRKNVKGFNWDIAPVPAKADQKDEGSLIVFAIPKQRPKANAAAAWQLLHFMGGPKGSRIFAQAGYFIPAYKASAKLIKPNGQPPPHVELFNDAAAHQTTMNFTTHDLRARQVYRPQLDLVHTGQKSAKEVLTSVKSNVEAAMVGKF